MRRIGGLRARITLLVVAVVVVCLALGFLAVYRGTVTQLRERTDADLREDMTALVAAVGHGSSGDLVAAAGRYVSGDGAGSGAHHQRAGAARAVRPRP